EGLVGQCAFEKKKILITDVPGDYLKITSGLGEAKPLNILVLPVLFEGDVRAVIELASFQRFSQTHQDFLDQLMDSIGIVLNSILILAQELADNPEGNLLPKQTEYATIIRSSGTDLLRLINDILDLSKIESGTVALEITDWPLSELPPLLERTFRHVAEATK